MNCIVNSFDLTCVLGGAVVHSYGRLILNERVITDRHQLQPPNNDTGDGRIECTVSSGEARFSNRRYEILTNDSQKAIIDIPGEMFNNFTNMEGYCAQPDMYYYLFLSKGEIIHGLKLELLCIYTYITRITHYTHACTHFQFFMLDKVN